MEGPLTTGYIEVTIVGDVTEEAASAITTRTLGTLPARAAEKTMAEPPKPVQMTAPAGYQRIEFVGELNVGMVLGNWPVEGKLDARAQAALQVLTKVLELRVRGVVREGSAFLRSHGRFQALRRLRGFRPVADDGGLHAGRRPPGGHGGRGPPRPSSPPRVSPPRSLTVRGALCAASCTAPSGKTISSSTPSARAGETRPRRGHRRPAGRPRGPADARGDQHLGAKILPAANCRTAGIVPKAFVGIFDSSK